MLGAAFGGGEAACELLWGPVWLPAAGSRLPSWVLLGGVGGGSRPAPAAGPAWLTSRSGSCTRQHCLYDWAFWAAARCESLQGCITQGRCRHCLLM